MLRLSVCALHSLFSFRKRNVNGVTKIFPFRSVDGDPISYNLPAARSEVSEEMWARPHQLEVMPLSKDNLEKALLA